MQNRVPFQVILSSVAGEFGLTLEELKGPQRSRRISHPRQIVMLLSKKMTPLSYPQIGTRLGGKHHTSVIHGVHACEDRIKDDPAWAARVSSVLERIEQWRAQFAYSQGGHS